MNLEQFLHNKPDTITGKYSLQDIVNIMFTQSLRYLVVLDEQNFPIGIVTERDILFFYEEGLDFHSTSISKFLSRRLIKSNANRSLEYALNLMIDHNIRRVIVIDDEEKYKGTVEQEEIIFEFEQHNQNKKLKIFEILLNESKALYVEHNASLNDALELMKEKNVGSMLVYKNDKPIGIITESDIVKLARDHCDKSELVKTYMHSPIVMVDLHTSMHECVQVMKKERIRRVVVEDINKKGGKCYYIITTKDILNNLQGNYSKFLEAKLLSYRSTFNNLNELVIEVFDFDDSKVISWSNKAAKQKLDINIDDSIENLIPQYTLQESYKAFEQGNSYVEERVEIRGRFYRYSAGRVYLFGIGVIKILLSDFTDLYLSNRLLKEQVGVMSDSINEQESMQQEILNQEAIGIGYISSEGEILFVNDYMNKLLGYKDDELIGRFISDITYKDDLALSDESRDKLIEDKKLQRFGFEKRYIHKDGSLIWAHISLSTSRDSKGKIKYIIGFLKDIRDRKENEKQLELSSAVFENTNEGIVIADKNLQIQAVNNSFSEITGYSEEEALGESALFLRSIHHDAKFYKKMWSAIKKEGFWKGEMWSVRKSNEPFPQWLNISVVKDSKGRVQNYIGIFSDISSIKQSEFELEFLAHHDPLTKLPNRLLLTARIEQAIKRAKRDKNKVAVLFLDLDRFKEINDTFGHSYGDAILIKVTDRFKKIMRDNDTIARIGGDEFVLLIEDIQNTSDIDPILFKVMDLFKDDIVVQNNPFTLSASIGIALYPDDGENIEELIKNADTAMYKAKDSGRNTYRFYTEDMTQDLFSKMLMKKEIVRGIEQEEFELFYQPQVSLETKKLMGVEALVRWRHPDMGLLTPDKFISISEQTKLIIPLGKYILQKACEQMKKWIEQSSVCKRISINISVLQMQQSDFYDDVLEVLANVGISGKHLEFEITESFMLQNPKESIKLFKKFRNLGISFAIDDFGTGYSSLSYLKQLPVDKLKIDRSFIMDIPLDSGDVAITSTIIAMSKSLGLNVIAEGIETKEQHELLKEKGCYEGQGYFYAKPLSIEDFEKFVKENR